jgi:uncharacterized membrane protein YkvA (DUF1232 family)
MIMQRRRLARRVPPISELLGRGSQSGSRIDGVRLWARKIKRDVVAVWIAARDNRVRWYVKALAASVAAYALSPIDLIPDFIPILGYLDDLVIVPLGILLVVRLIPTSLMDEFRAAAELRIQRPTSIFAAAVILSIWIAVAGGALWWLWPRLAAV